MVIKQIEEKFGKMTVTRGNAHVFLGLSFVFNPEGTAFNEGLLGGVHQGIQLGRLQNSDNTSSKTSIRHR
jgi:hypothetical protein